MTPNSPLPSRVSPLRITLIGRRNNCASSAATITAISSDASRDVDGRTERGVQLRRISTVETPMRIDPNASSPSNIGGCTSRVRPCLRIDHAQLVERARFFSVAMSARAAAAYLPASGRSGAGRCLRVENSGAGHILAVDAGFENGARPGIAPQRHVRIAVGDDDDFAARWKIALASSSPRAWLS